MAGRAGNETVAMEEDHTPLKDGSSGKSDSRGLLKTLTDRKWPAVKSQTKAARHDGCSSDLFQTGALMLGGVIVGEGMDDMGRWDEKIRLKGLMALVWVEWRPYRRIGVDKGELLNG